MSTSSFPRCARPGSPRVRAARGFSLIELIIVLLLVTLLLITMYASFFRTQRVATTVTRSVSARQGGRAAVQLLERDLRMAGSGWGRTSVQGAFGGQPLTLSAVNPGYGGAVGTCDSMSIVGATAAGTTLRSAMPTTSTTIYGQNTTGFANGDFVVITNNAGAHMFQATAVLTSPADLQHATTSSYNAAGGHLGWPVGGYGVGANVYRATWVSYRIDSLNYSKPSLVRREVGRASQLVAYNVSSFQVWYHMTDGSITRNPQNLLWIDEVVPVVKVSDGTKVLPDSAWATIRPRAF
jgi:prepilin-type N-terminal cleavage/methylation domain-containing protein